MSKLELSNNSTCSYNYWSTNRDSRFLIKWLKCIN